MQQLQAATIPVAGFLRLRDIIGDPEALPPKPALIPVSESSWWKGVRAGRYPQPVRGLGKRLTVWRARDILEFIESFDADCVHYARSDAASRAKATTHSKDNHTNAEERPTGDREPTPRQYRHRAVPAQS